MKPKCFEVGSGSWQLSAAGERKDLEIPGTGLGRDLRCDEHVDIVVLLTFEILAGSCILSLSHQTPVTTLLYVPWVRELSTYQKL